MIPSLQQLDGSEVTPSERIQANQRLEEIVIDLKTSIELKRMEEARKKDENVDTSNDYTKEYRRKMYKELEEEKISVDKRRNPDKYVEKVESSRFTKDGTIRQCNEGKYKYLLREWDDPEFTTFTMNLPKFLETSLVDANIEPNCISVRVKEKLTQIRLNEEVIVEKSSVQRSQVTGIP